MANTAKLRYLIEPYVRSELEKIYIGHIFTEKRLPLRKKKDGTYAYHNFDAVSDDNSIIASIKSHSWFTSGGKLPSGKIGQIYQSIYFMNLVEAKTKLMIFTDYETYERFKEYSNGKLDDNIEIKYIKLSDDLNRICIEIRNAASEEMTRQNRNITSTL